MQKADFKEEKEKLEDTIKLAKEELKVTETMYEKLEQNTYDEETIYNLSRSYSNKIKNLKKSILNPYFARVDFKEKNSEKQKIYIGKANIFDEDLNVAVADWRAPISSIYYDGEIGNIEYKCPEGIIKGDLSLKRQYKIDEGNLLDYQDIEITTNDEMLQDALSASSDVRLKNIVATIQKEQNKIIRASMFKPLIVQGVAGSGKTTVALHRIAYLVYTYEKQFRPDDFLIIGPNKFFLSYISDTLPDLGVENVKQETCIEFANEYLKEKLKIENENYNLQQIVDNSKKNEIDEKKSSELNKLKAKNDMNITNIMKEAEFKSSISFKNYIDECLKEYNENYLPKEDFMVKNVVAIKYDDLYKMFIDDWINISLEDRKEKLKKYMINKMKDYSEQIVDKLTEERRARINSIDENLNDKDKLNVRKEIFEEYEQEINSLLKNRGKELVNNYFKRLKKPVASIIYKEIINDEKLNKYFENAKYLRDNFNKKIREKKVQYEDVSALLYITLKIFKRNEKFNLKHIIIDEAQDYSEFQFLVIYEILNKNKSITILGDIAQGIYSYRGTSNWQNINEKIFAGDAEICYLDKSYRTTKMIMDEANKVILKAKDKLNINLAECISKTGEKPEYFEVKDFEGKIEFIENKIEDAKNKGYKNIGIITKNTKLSEKIYKELIKQYPKVEMLSENQTEYSGGITIVPSYYSKGLEFDSVIIADRNSYSDDILDVKLLYVVMTRAMHQLSIIK